MGCAFQTDQELIAHWTCDSPIGLLHTTSINDNTLERSVGYGRNSFDCYKELAILSIVIARIETSSRKRSVCVVGSFVKYSMYSCNGITMNTTYPAQQSGCLYTS